MALVKKVTLLVTHFNRSSSLERLLHSFKSLNLEFEAIVVSDDGSDTLHLEKLHRMSQEFKFQLVTAPINRGLGNNINKGQDQIETEYTLYVQEDFVPKLMFKKALLDAVGMLDENSSFDTVRFYAYFRYPYLKPYQNGFSEMIFSSLPWYPDYRKFYYYSDHPHLRRSTFFEKFGRYCEDIPVERTEYRMMMSYLKKRGRSFFFDRYNDLFDQVNSAVEPSTVKRNFWRESNNPLVSFIRHLYRIARFHFDYFRLGK